MTHERPCLVDALHLSEILRRFRLTSEYHLHELVFVGHTERPVEETLIPNGAVRDRAQPLAAGRSRTMARPDLQPVGIAPETLKRRIQRARCTLHRAFDLRRPLQQIRPTHVANEHEVARHHGDGFAGGGRVGDQKAEMLRRMPGRMHGGHHDIADLERISILEQGRTVAERERVLPIGITFVGEIQRGARAMRKFARPGHEIRVNVRLGHVRDGHPLGLRHVEILFDVTIRVDDDGRAGTSAADEIAGLREFRVVKPFDDHARTPDVAGDVNTTMVCLRAVIDR